MPKKPTDRERQVATRKRRHGEDAYAKMASNRLMSMTPEERSEFARRSVTKRWHPDWTDEQITEYLENKDKEE